MAIKRRVRGKAPTHRGPDAPSEARKLADTQKLADSPSPAAVRGEQGDWAKVSSPSPSEQQAESLRDDAIRSLEQ